jgi:hypothetical protein
LLKEKPIPFNKVFLIQQSLITQMGSMTDDDLVTTLNGLSVQYLTGRRIPSQLVADATDSGIGLHIAR